MAAYHFLLIIQKLLFSFYHHFHLCAKSFLYQFKVSQLNEVKLSLEYYFSIHNSHYFQARTILTNLRKYNFSLWINITTGFDQSQHISQINC